MATYSIGDIVTGIANTLSEAPALKHIQNYDELKEDVPEWPTLQVYPQANTGTSRDSENAYLTLGDATSGQRRSVKVYTIHADLYAKRRGPYVGEEMLNLVDAIDDLEDILDTQPPCSAFGLGDIIASFVWLWDRVVFDYAGTEYMGARFVIEVRIK